MADEAKTFTQEQVEALVAEQVGALREKNEELIGELRSASAKLKSYDGVDVKSMTARLAELEQQSKAEKAGMTSEALAKLRQDVEVDVVKRLQSDQTAALRLFPWAEDLAKENRSLKLDSVVKAEMAKGGARAERVDALFRLTADRWDLTEDGKPVLKDKPATELGKYVADELRKEYPEFYTGSGSTGGGASRSKGAVSTTPGFIQADAESYRANVEKLARGEVKMVTP
jgi:hypothetical protein